MCYGIKPFTGINECRVSGFCLLGLSLEIMIVREVLIIKDDAKKISMMLIIGLCVAVIIYPALHELGHSVAAIIAGAKIIEFNLFPIPSVLCNVRDVNTTGMVLISVSGSFFPLLLVIFSPKRFVGWYSCFTVRWISLLAYIFSEVAVISFVCGKPIKDDDITYALQINQQYAWIFMILYLTLIILTSVLIIKSKPIKYLSLEMEK